RPDGPSTRPRSRKIATCGKPVRSTQPESKDETRTTIPISARVAGKCSSMCRTAHQRPIGQHTPARQYRTDRRSSGARVYLWLDAYRALRYIAERVARLGFRK